MSDRLKPLLKESTASINFDDPDDFKSSTLVLLNSFREKGKVSILKRPIREVLSNSIYRKFIYYSFSNPNMKVAELVDFYFKNSITNEDLEEKIVTLRSKNESFNDLFSTRF